MAFNILMLVSLIYVIALFAVAFYADRSAQRGGTKWLRLSLIHI